jgi:hypothetical protein
MGQATVRHLRGEDVIRSRHLEYWLAQERLVSIPDDQPSTPVVETERGDMPGGWWLLPVMAMAVPMWGLILWLIFG